MTDYNIVLFAKPLIRCSSDNGLRTQAAHFPLKHRRHIAVATNGDIRLFSRVGSYKKTVRPGAWIKETSTYRRYLTDLCGGIPVVCSPGGLRVLPVPIIPLTAESDITGPESGVEPWTPPLADRGLRELYTLY